MAATQVNLRRYSNAAQHLEQALDHQRNVESAIQSDLALLHFRLGATHALAGDLDRAIDCMQECLEILEEDSCRAGSALVAPTLLKLANLLHVKGLLQSEDSSMHTLVSSAHAHAQQAFNLDQSAFVRVQLANHLLQGAQSADALDLLLPLAFLPASRRCLAADVTFSGVEHTLLPVALQCEADEADVFVVDSRVFAHLLAVQCCRHLGLEADLTDVLESMVEVVGWSRRASSWSMLGHALLEGRLYVDAAESFATAASLSCDAELATLARLHCFVCLLLHTFESLKLFVCELMTMTVPTASITDESASTTSAPRDVSKNLNLIGSARRTVWRELENRDSGYFDENVSNSTHLLTSSSASTTENLSHATPQTDAPWLNEWNLESVMNGNVSSKTADRDHRFESVAFERHLSDGSSGKRCSSDDCTDSDASMRDVSDDECEWQVFEETVETPPEILAFIAGRITL